MLAEFVFDNDALNKAMLNLIDTTAATATTGDAPTLPLMADATWQISGHRRISQTFTCSLTPAVTY